MKVHELRTILDHLPDDLPVCISGRSGSRGLCHIAAVHRQTGERRGVRLDSWPARALWFDPEPDFLLSGPFRRADELLARLGDEPIGVPS